MRIRLELARDGQATATAARFFAHPPETIWRVAIASTRLDSSDPLLRHKTTRRATYAAAREEFPTDEIDEAILLNEDGFVCEGTITNVFIRREPDGPLLTPPHSCGLLPGVLRQELIDTDRAFEAEISLTELETADSIFVGNSLRSLMPATFIDFLLH